MEVFSVSECLRRLNAVLQSQAVVVEGEVQGFRVSQGRWGFFSLKDDGGILECFMMAFRIRVPLEDGMTIRVTATPGIHHKSGRFRLMVEHIEVVGEGALKRAFELLRRQLEAEGLFSETRKRILPRFPQAIGLIASPESAAYSDFLKVLTARFSGVTVYVMPVAVQGERGVPEIIQALSRYAHFEETLDVIVITRGGGSLEDLMAFNDESLARAIFKSPIPVVAAIGHERDITIADYVADVRASTPSNAAELLVPDRREVTKELTNFDQRIESAVRRRLMLITHDLDRATHTFISSLEQRLQMVHTVIRKFFSAIQSFRAREQVVQSEILQHQHRFQHAVTRRYRQAEDALVGTIKRLTSLHPKRLLARGYSIVRHRGRVVKSRRQVAVGVSVEITLSDGQIAADITSHNI